MQCIELTFGIHQKICPNVTKYQYVFLKQTWQTARIILRLEAVWDFPGGLLMKTPHFSARSVGSIPGWEAKMPHAWPKKFLKITKKNPKKQIEAVWA